MFFAARGAWRGKDFAGENKNSSACKKPRKPVCAKRNIVEQKPTSFAEGNFI